MCHDCGVEYERLGLDLVLPDQQWKALFPEESGLLCANCICKRAAKLGGTAILAWIDNIDWGLVEERASPTTQIADATKVRPSYMDTPKDQRAHS